MPFGELSLHLHLLGLFKHLNKSQVRIKMLSENVSWLRFVFLSFLCQNLLLNIIKPMETLAWFSDNTLQYFLCKNDIYGSIILINFSLSSDCQQWNSKSRCPTAKYSNANVALQNCKSSTVFVEQYFYTQSWSITARILALSTCNCSYFCAIGFFCE